MSAAKGSTIFLFDMDGTLTKSRQTIEPDMWNFLKSLRAERHIPLAIVSGSDFAKCVEQLGGDTSALCALVDFVFAENGMVGCGRGGEPLPTGSLAEALGEDRLQDVINFCLKYIAELRLPVKRGTFIEFRKGMLNVSPIGRSCSQAERDQFVEYERTHPIRVPFVAELRRQFADYGLTFSIGGQISIDVFPNGWDKTYCLRYLTPYYENIHFFGDRTYPGGNDHEIFEHAATIGHTVENPEHTRKVITDLLTPIQ